MYSEYYIPIFTFSSLNLFVYKNLTFTDKHTRKVLGSLKIHSDAGNVGVEKGKLATLILVLVTSQTEFQVITKLSM